MAPMPSPTLRAHNSIPSSEGSGIQPLADRTPQRGYAMRLLSSDVLVLYFSVFLFYLSTQQWTCCSANWAVQLGAVCWALHCVRPCERVVSSSLRGMLGTVACMGLPSGHKEAFDPLRNRGADCGLCKEESGPGWAKLA